MIRKLTLIALLAGVAACAGPAQPQFDQKDIAALRTLTHDLVAAYNAKNPQQTTSFFAGNGVLMPPNSSIVRGRDAIQTFYDSRFKQGQSDLQIDPDEIAGQGELAYVSGSYSVKTAPAGGAGTSDRGKFLWIARKLPSGWRWEYQMWSSDLDHPMAN